MATKLLSEVQKEDFSKEQCVASGMEALDKITGGFRNSTFAVVAARPAMGCRTLALTCASNQACAGGKSQFSASHSLNPKLLTDCKEYTTFLAKKTVSINLKTKFL